MTEDEHKLIDEELARQKADMLSQISGVKPARQPMSPFKSGDSTVPVDSGAPAAQPLPPPDLTHKGTGAIDSLVGDALEAGAIGSLQDPDFQQNIKEKSKGFLQQGVNKIGNQLTKDEQETAYDANSEACDNVGINKGSPKWAIDWARFENNLWTGIWLIVSFVTVLPINVFSKGLKKFFKNSWVALVLAIVIWALIVTSPLWGTWIAKMRGGQG